LCPYLAICFLSSLLAAYFPTAAAMVDVLLEVRMNVVGGRTTETDVQI
jgi:hypothetical protein